MSLGRCPVCHAAKERRVHLVCPNCWVKVPEADQREVYTLFDAARGPRSTAKAKNRHRMKCLEVVLALHRARKAAAPRVSNRSPGDLPLGRPQMD